MCHGRRAGFAAPSYPALATGEEELARARDSYVAGIKQIEEALALALR